MSVIRFHARRQQYGCQPLYSIDCEAVSSACEHFGWFLNSFSVIRAGSIRSCTCRAFYSIIDQIPEHMRQHVKRVAVDATSPTVVLIDRASGAVLEPAKLYHEAQPPAAVQAAVVRSQISYIPLSYCLAHFAFW